MKILLPSLHPGLPAGLLHSRGLDAGASSVWRDLLTINDSVRTRIAEHIRARPEDYEAFVGPSLKMPEALAFMESHQGAVSLERTVGRATVHVLPSRR
jgi:hypothetical protein